MNVNFELYKIFYAVANNKSISKGAEELMISQPAVTQSIKTLEDQLGGILFIRTKKGVILTNEGEELYKYIKEGMNFFVNGTNKFMSLKMLDSGVIKIGATTTISEHILMPYLKSFHDRYKNVIIKITNNLTENLIKDLRNGSIDIAVISIPDNNYKDISIVEIKNLHDIFIGNIDYIEYNNKDINEILKSQIIVQQKPSVNRTNIDEFIKEKNLTLNPFMEVVSHNLLVNLVENGFGIGIATKEFIENELKEKKLFELKTNINIPSRKLGYAVMKDTIPTFSVKKLIDIIINRI